MTEGDYGVSVPIVVKGVTIDSGDTVLLTVKKSKNGSLVLEKEFTGITSNTIDLEFTEDETMMLKVGNYVYSLDWYKDGEFYYCLVENSKLKVGDKI